MGADVTAGPSRWAVDRFGLEVASELWVRIPQAIGAAVERAMDAHAASQMTTYHAFGNSRWPLQYEELVNHLQGVDGAAPVRPPRAFYQLVVVREHILIPWCYAETFGIHMRDVKPGRSLGRLGRELLGHFDPLPRWQQPTLPLTPDERGERDVAELSTIGPHPRVLLVGYACNARDGLLKVCWGEAALAEDGCLLWGHDEELPLPPVRACEAG